MKIEYDRKAFDIKGPASPIEIAKEIGMQLKGIIAAKIGETLVDLSRKVDCDGGLSFLDFNSKEGKEIFWHSSAHIMAAAVKRLFPDILLGMGPAIDEGFYYDFYGVKLGDNDLARIEQEIQKIIKEDSKFVRKEVSKEEAKALMRHNRFKLEIIDESTPPYLIYETGDFVDLCRGPHVPSTRYVKAVKLLKVSGAYWKGDSKRDVMTRVYGISFPSKEELESYLKLESERDKHDHKKLGRALELFETSPLSPGSPFFLPKGAIVYNELVRLAREMDKKYGYQEIITPIIAKSDVWKTSGHYDKYRENMYRVNPFTGEDEEYALKPMNCPFSTIVFKSRIRSYRDLPLRFSDYGFLHRYELEGTLDGLFRTRLFEQNDAHIYATEDQLEGEISKILDMMKELYAIFNFTPIMVLATRPEKRIGAEEEWDKGEEVLKSVLENGGYKYTVKEGDGAFYGPKIDVYVLDFTGRPESAYAVFTVQIDFNLANRFGVRYVGADNKEHVPVVIHRAVMGSIGRFMGIILENTAGDLPVWLSPEQVRVLPITDRNKKYSASVTEKLVKEGVRANADESNSTLDYRIREAQLMRVPYVLVVGDKEEATKTIAVRTRDGKTKYGVGLEDFSGTMLKRIKERTFQIA